jgi:hypothetical protein
MEWKMGTYSAGAVVASTDDLVTSNLDAADRVLVPGQKMKQDSLLDVPDAQVRVSRSRDGDRAAVEHLEASDRRRVTTEDVLAHTAKRGESVEAPARLEGG